MDIKIEQLKKNLPKECCSFCKHLTLEGPNENYEYNIKCIMSNSLPIFKDSCNYFETEHSNLKSSDLDDLYNNFLESCIKINYKEYLNSTHWQLFKDYVIKQIENECCICGCNTDLNVVHLNKNLGREALEDVTLVCNSCISKS